MKNARTKQKKQTQYAKKKKKSTRSIDNYPINGVQRNTNKILGKIRKIK